MNKQSGLSRYAYASKRASVPVDKSKGFAVYQCGKVVYVNSTAAFCHYYIKQNGLKGAVVGYAK